MTGSKHLELVTLLFFITSGLVSSSRAGNMAIERIDSREFPIVRVQFVLPGTTMENPLRASHFRILENGNDVGLVSLAIQQDPLAIEMVLDYHNAWAMSVGCPRATSLEAGAAASITASGLTLESAELARAGLETRIEGVAGGWEPREVVIPGDPQAVEAGPEVVVTVDDAQHQVNQAAVDLEDTSTWLE